MPRKPSTSKQASTSLNSNNKRASNKQRIVDSSSGDDSDENYTKRPSTSTQNRTLTQNFNETQRNTVDLTAATTNMVKYLLNFSATKIPIKRTDITKNINIGSKDFPEVFKDCTALLSDVYGLEVAEVGEKSSRAYILYTARRMGVSLKQYTLQQQSEVTLLFIILSYIFMKGGNVQEAHLIHFLAQLNIETNINEPDMVFGDVSKMIRDKFTRQLYLKRIKAEIEGSNEAQIHFTWGARAEREFEKKHILKAVGKIMNKSPATFINQYHEATQGEREDVSMVID